MNAFHRFIGHLTTITRHRHMVIAQCAKAGILWQGIFHDLSKYSPAEFLPGVKYYSGEHSPTEDERRENGYSKAWMHHKGRNRHHWEYWTDYDYSKNCYMPAQMPRRYVAEMLCDRIAASKIYKGGAYTDAAPYEYLAHGRMRDNMNPETLDVHLRFLVQLRDEGETAMFAALRAYVREKEF